MLSRTYTRSFFYFCVVVVYKCFNIEEERTGIKKSEEETQKKRKDTEKKKKAKEGGLEGWRLVEHKT